MQLNEDVLARAFYKRKSLVLVLLGILKQRRAKVLPHFERGKSAKKKPFRCAI